MSEFHVLLYIVFVFHIGRFPVTNVGLNHFIFCVIFLSGRQIIFSLIIYVAFVSHYLSFLFCFSDWNVFVMYLYQIKV